MSLAEKFHAAASLGVMVALVQDDVTWSETLAVNSASTTGYWTGSSSITASSSGVAAGIYGGVDLGYDLTESVSLIAGARVQSLGTYKHDLGAGKMELDLGSAFSVNVGIAWRF